MVGHSEAIPAPGGLPLVSAISWCCSAAGFKTWLERNRGRLRDRRLKSFSLEAVGRECGCNVHSIWPTSFGRNSGRGIIQCRSEIGVAEVLPENFNILVRAVCHGVGKKALRKFKGFFWSSKPEDALCDGQKFVGVNHRSLAYGAKP